MPGIEVNCGSEYETGSAGLKNVSLDALSQAYQMVTAAVGPSVVHIEVERRGDLNDSAVANMLGGGLSPASDQGSGVIVDTAGYIVHQSTCHRRRSGNPGHPE